VGSKTVTFVRRGLIDHSDSLGATARFGRGDVQWLTAGNGIVHAEMFPLLDRDHPNPVELFQIWLNLPASDKRVDPYFTMLWDRDIPRHTVHDDDGRSATITVIAGAFAGLTPPAASAQLVGGARRIRSRDLALAARRRRRVRAATRARARHRANAVLLRRHEPARRRA
jgi:redox-sensitive bicupin YhaK (pirin superfamily)